MTHVLQDKKASKPKYSQSDLTRERWTRGRLSYKLHAGQIKIDEAYRSCLNQLFVAEISRQFGKTFWLVIKSLEVAFSKPKARCKIGTAFQTDLLEFILPTFDMVMEDCPEDIRPVWKSQKSKFVLSNGSEIQLVGLDRKPNGLRGNKIDFIGLDEVGFMSNLDYLYKSVIIPATTHRPDCRIVMCSTPPSTPAHEFLEYVHKAELEGAYLKLTIYDNPIITPETIQRLMKESGGEESTTWKREYLCSHITDANLQVVPEWDDRFWVETPKEDVYVYYHKYVAMDLGVRDNTAVIFAYYDFKRAALVIEDEYVVNGPELTTEVLQREVKRKEYELWGNEPKVYRRISDNNNPLLLQDLSHLHGIHFSPTSKASLEEMVNALKMLVRAGGVLVHPRCKQVRGCLKYGVWDKHRDKFAKSNAYGHFDALAALIYLCRHTDRVTNPIPFDHRADRMNQFVVDKKQYSQGVKSLKQGFGMK